MFSLTFTYTLFLFLSATLTRYPNYFYVEMNRESDARKDQFLKHQFRFNLMVCYPYYSITTNKELNHLIDEINKFKIQCLIFLMKSFLNI